MGGGTPLIPFLTEIKRFLSHSLGFKSGSIKQNIWAETRLPISLPIPPSKTSSTLQETQNECHLKLLLMKTSTFPLPSSVVLYNSYSGLYVRFMSF